jgi:hypothetical protein
VEFDFLSNGRKIIWVGNEKLQIGVANGGGHIAVLRLPGFSEKSNPFWIPPWPSLEPESVTDSLVNSDYGGAPEGRLLASILGHSLALDLYGAPSEEERALGAVTHGRVGVSVWKWKLHERHVLEGQCRDPSAHLLFTRRLRVNDHCVVVTETIENLCAWDRPIGWQQHVSLGPPFCEEGFWAQSNCDLGFTHPQTFGSGASLVPGTETRWPLAPRRAGGSCDYRQPLGPDAIANDFTGYRVRPTDDHGSLVLGNTNLGFALFYVWPRRIFPWLGIWDERHARDSKPWNKRASVRAYEFGVSPFPEMRREMLARPSLGGLPTYMILPAKGTLWVRYMFGVFNRITDQAEFVLSQDTAALEKDGHMISQIELPEKCSGPPQFEVGIS